MTSSQTCEHAVRSALLRVDTVARRAGLLALYVLALSVDLSTAGFNVALALICVTTIPLAGAIWGDVRDFPAFWLVTALTAYVVVQSLVLASYHPVMNESSNPHWSHMARVTGLVSLIIGWWMFQYRRHIPWFLLLVVVSLFANRLLAIDYPAFLDDPFGRRALWGDASVRVGFASAAGAVMCFATLIYLAVWERAGRRSWFRSVGMASALLGFLAFLVALYGSQTRGAWLGALVACALLLILMVIRAVRTRRGMVSAMAGAILLVVALGVTISVDPGNVLEKRVAGEHEAVSAIMSLDGEALYEANRSMGRRVNMWTEALTALRDRPWFGYGTGTKPLLAQRSDLDFGNPAGHLHSIYVEIVYSLGIAGALGFAITYWTLFRGFARAWRRDLLPVGVALVTAGFWVMALATLLTDVRVGHSTSRALLMFMLAVICYGALTLHRSQRERGETTMHTAAE